MPLVCNSHFPYFLSKKTLLNDILRIFRLFHKIDLDNDGSIERGELQAFIVGVNFEDIDLDSNLAADQVMADFDRSHNNFIEKGEFIDGVLRWLEEAKRAVASSGVYSKKFMDDFHTVSF
jgi:Ca2+-binding EF-hand superfamily protein